MRKKIKYCSENGLMFKFGDKAPYYLEKINATSISGVFTTDIIPNRLGQVTTSKTLGSRTVICELAVMFSSDDMRMFKNKYYQKLQSASTRCRTVLLRLKQISETMKLTAILRKVRSMITARSPGYIVLRLT